MWPHAVIIFLSAAHMTTFVAARFCEGGHICSLPRECCTQGCCPPYQSGPRQLPPPSEHVLNLFFISHWFFWCVVVAIILAILCAYSLWKKRRTLCGWGFADHHAQSEGDSAGSCYAPPQYSRCNSFHHPPPPYTEVTSKPDLYPLVFTCNSDNGKNGSSYLMVQYFRNYIVRPAVAGSLSAASTIDSLSSSFICNANEANTLVPPPYSRAASPEVGGFTSHYPLHHHHQQQQPSQQQQQQHSQQQQPHHHQHHHQHPHQLSHPHHQHPSYMMPRSASQLVCASGSNANGHATTAEDQTTMDVAGGGNLACQQVYQHHPRHSHYAVTGPMNGRDHQHQSQSSTLQVTESEPDVNTNAAELRASGGGFVQSQSDQHFRYMGNSNSSISDIFVNQSSGGGGGLMVSSVGRVTTAADALSLSSSAMESVSQQAIGGTPVIFSNGRIKPHPLHRTSTNPTQFVASAEAHREPVYNSLNSIEGISIAMPASSALAVGRPSSDGADTEFRDLHRLRHSLETCCQLLQYQTQQQQQQQQQREQQQLIAPITNYVGSSGDSPLRMHELCGAKKFNDEGLRSYLTSGTCSAVSSLANIGTPSSPPQATSPTGEVKEILEQIRQLQEDVSYEDLLLGQTPQRPSLQHTMSTPARTQETNSNSKLKRFSTMLDSADSAHRVTVKSRSKTSLTSPTSSSSPARYTSAPSSKTMAQPASGGSNTKRPSTLQQTKKKFYSPKPNKAMYIPMTANSGSSPMHTSQPRGLLKSPVGANFFGSRGSRVRMAWISRSAPTTPGTNLPPNRMGDDSPLLNEHDEDPEGEQIAEME